MIEMLVTVSIIVLLGALSLAGILAAKKHANETRVRDDLRLIETALQAYHEDSNGSYPVFADAATDQSSVTNNVQGNGTWLDYSQARGAVLLCRALIGPGPAGVNTTGIANPGDDGADGPGFRVRRSAGLTQFGKVYGAYLDSSKFKLSYLTPPSAYSSFTMAYPVILDSNGTPILYYPGATGNPQYNVSYADPSTTTTNAIARFNGFDNEQFVDATDHGSSYQADSPFAVLVAQSGTPPFLLWTAGADGVFGLVNGKSDDIANFDLPANLTK